FSIILPSLTSFGIDTLLKRGRSDTAIGIDKQFFTSAIVNVHINQLLNHRRHILGAKRRAKYHAQGCLFARAAAQLDLIKLFAFFINTQNPDVTYVVMTTSVHTAGYVEVNIAQVIHVIEIVKLTLNRFGNRDGFSVSKRAEVAAGAADDIGQGANIWCCETGLFSLLPQREQVSLFHTGKNDVLFVRGADFTKTVLVSKFSNFFQLGVSDITGRYTRRLER